MQKLNYKKRENTMISGHEISTDFCNIKVEGRVVTNEPMKRKEEKSLEQCREKHTTEPSRGFQGAKTQYKTWEQFRAK